jgi:hypothetical protein
MAPSADLIAAGDLDGDGTDDLLWSKAGDGVWVKSSTTMNWTRLTPAAAGHMDAGLMRGGTNPWPSASIGGLIDFPAPRGGYADGPGSISEYVDLSDKGPGGWNFDYSEEANLVPQENDSGIMMKIAGPGEPGFRYFEQKNLMPQKKQENGKKKNE